MSDDAFSRMTGAQQAAHVAGLADDAARAEFFEERWPHPSGNADLQKIPPHLQGVYTTSLTNLRRAEEGRLQAENFRRSALRTLTEISDAEDPRVSNLYSHMTPSERAAQRTKILAMGAERGIAIDETPPTPDEIALERLDAQYGRPFDAYTASQIEARTEALEAKGALAVEAAITALQAKLGPARYNALVERAKKVLEAGKDFPKAVLGDEYALKSFAIYADYLRRGEAARAKVTRKGSP